MKEKIGMLIELANKYEIEKEKSEGVNVDSYVEFKWEWVGEGYLNKGLTRFDETDHWEGDNLYGDTAVAYLISKSFGMIKWLVENDKIEFREDFYLEDQHGGGFGEDEDIIMLLAIQDEPIRFLCEILK